MTPHNRQRKQKDSKAAQPQTNCQQHGMTRLQNQGTFIYVPTLMYPHHSRNVIPWPTAIYPQHSGNYIPTFGVNPQHSGRYRQRLIQQCTEILNHASRCQAVNCSIGNCASMKRVWKHVSSCEAKNTKRNCKVCLNVAILFNYHAKHCQNSSCEMLYCNTIKSGQRKTA